MYGNFYPNPHDWVRILEKSHAVTITNIADQNQLSPGMDASVRQWPQWPGIRPGPGHHAAQQWPVWSGLSFWWCWLICCCVTCCQLKHVHRFYAIHPISSWNLLDLSCCMENFKGWLVFYWRTIKSKKSKLKILRYRNFKISM